LFCTAAECPKSHTAEQKTKQIYHSDVQYPYTDEWRSEYKQCWVVMGHKSNALLFGVTSSVTYYLPGIISKVTSYFFTVTSNVLPIIFLGNGPSLEIAGFCIYISNFSIHCIHILI